MNSSSDLFVASKIELIYYSRLLRLTAGQISSLCLTCGSLYVFTVGFFDRVLALVTTPLTSSEKNRDSSNRNR